MLRCKDSSADCPAPGSQTEGSEKEGSRSESSFDADSEASESETALKQAASSPASSSSALQLTQLSARTAHSKAGDSSEELISSAMAKLSFCDATAEEKRLSRGDPTLGLANTSTFAVDKSSLPQNPQNAFQTLSQSYITSSKECSVQSCLYQFTSVELLMGNNKLWCESCTERRQKRQRKSSGTGKGWAGVGTPRGCRRASLLWLHGNRAPRQGLLAAAESLTPRRQQGCVCRFPW